jgi:hydrogenase expression/formation protein HypC
MCLSVVAKIIKLVGDEAIVELNGVKKRIEVGLLADQISEGDWVLVHTGFAIAKINETRAREILSAYSIMNEVANKVD